MMLDDPSSFVIVAKVADGKTAEFRAWIAVECGISNMMAHQIFGKSVRENNYVPIYGYYGWFEIPPLLNKIPAFVEAGTVHVLATGASVGDECPFCSIHQIYHPLPQCPVCSDNIIHYGKRNIVAIN